MSENPPARKHTERAGSSPTLPNPHQSDPVGKMDVPPAATATTGAQNRPSGNPFRHTSQGHHGTPRTHELIARSASSKKKPAAPLVNQGISRQNYSGGPKAKAHCAVPPDPMKSFSGQIERPLPS